MLTNLSESNNQIVDKIMQLSATTEQVTASSVVAKELSERNLNDAENTRNVLEEILEISKKLDMYIAE